MMKHNNFNTLLGRKWFIVACLVLFSISAFSQTYVIRGLITDKDGPMPGVKIQIENSSTGTSSDVNGNYVIQVKKGDMLVFSLVGYETTKVRITKEERINVRMSDKIVQLDDVVVVGYGTMRKRDITGSISSIDSKDILSNTPTDIASALQGKLSGVEIISNTGQPGDNSVMRIRGTGTLSAGGAEPLYIVDGVEVERINDINPNDVASIEVLKDAASAAIYGSKSGNGVILITTKQGEKDKPRINVDYVLKSGQLSHKLPQMNRLEGKMYDSISNYFSGGNFYVASDSLNPGYLFDNDYQDMLFRTAYTNQLNVSASGGADKFTYFVSGGLLDEQGIMLETFYKRMNGRLRMDYQLSKRLKIGGTYSFSQSDQKTAPWQAKSYLSRPSAYGMKYPDGSYVPVLSARPNPMAVLELGKFNTKWYTVTMHNYVQYEIIKNLIFNTSLSGTLNLSRYNEFYPAILSQNLERTGAQTTGFSQSWANDNTLTYRFSINKDHNFSSLLGFSIMDRYSNDMALYVRGNITDATPYPVNYTTVNMNRTQVSISGNKLASVFGRLTYNYKGRYLFNSNIRADGSTRFGANNRWGLFPSFSTGWRFTDEKFMDWSKSFFTDGKLRLSYGIVGNQAVGNFATNALYSSTYYADYVGIYPSQLENKELKWEKNQQFNLGLDINLFNGRANLILDYYNKRSSDVLFNVGLPRTSGFGSSFMNVGDITNKGFEISLSTVNVNTRNFRWSTTFNFSTNKNMILSIPEGGRYLTYWVFLVEAGYPVGTMWGYQKKGIFSYDESNAFTPQGNQLTPIFDDRDKFLKYQLNGHDYEGEIVNLKYNSPNGALFKGGDVIWDDVNNDGVIDVEDQQVIGNGQPDFIGGLTNEFSYKNFTLTAFFNYSFGNDIYNKNKANDNNFGVSSLTRPNPLVLQQAWTAPGDIAEYPQPQGGIAGVQNTRSESSMWVEDGSFIRLKTIKINYLLPNKWAKAISVKNLNVYASLNNFFTWTNYSGFDPEIGAGGIFAIGYDGTTYPRTKEFIFGINLNL